MHKLRLFITGLIKVLKTIDMKQISIVLILIYLFVAGCYYDKYDKLYPPSTNTGCDSSNVTYSVTVRGILDNYCMGCHNAATASGGAVLVSYSDVNNYVVNGLLMGDIKQLSGFVPMPPGAKLNDCDIAKLQKWVNDGAPNN